MMLVLTCAKFTADLLSPSFDHVMMHMQHLPFLEEEPPKEFDVLTACDVMAPDVVVRTRLGSHAVPVSHPPLHTTCVHSLFITIAHVAIPPMALSGSQVLREVEHVGDLVDLLQGVTHNGFPIVDEEAHFGGLILRRQLLALLAEGAWQMPGEPPAPQLTGAAARRFVESESSNALAESDVLNEVGRGNKRNATINLRPYLDPSPYVVSELMPLRRVYRLFNEIGVRHLTVVDSQEKVVGIITRKDILPEAIEQRVLNEASLEESRQWLLARKMSGLAHSLSLERVRADGVAEQGSLSSMGVGVVLGKGGNEDSVGPRRV